MPRDCPYCGESVDVMAHHLPCDEVPDPKVPEGPEE